MSELLLEVGCEELPASFVRRAYTDLLENLATGLTEAGVVETPGTAMGTPRRLVVSFLDLKERQEDQTKEVRGPGIKAAYAADGSSTPALLGFCRSQGVEPDSLRKDDQYVWATKLIPGRPTAEILVEAIPKAI
jgi:glycyl-tRNA synthetase beta chain